MAKDPLFQDQSGDIGAVCSTFEVTDPAFPKTVTVIGLKDRERLDVVFENFDEDGFEPLQDGGKVFFDVFHNKRIIYAAGTYKLDGVTENNVTGWTE